MVGRTGPPAGPAATPASTGQIGAPLHPREHRIERAVGQFPSRGRPAVVPRSVGRVPGLRLARDHEPEDVVRMGPFEPGGRRFAGSDEVARPPAFALGEIPDRVVVEVAASGKRLELGPGQYQGSKEEMDPTPERGRSQGRPGSPARHRLNRAHRGSFRPRSRPPQASRGNDREGAARGRGTAPQPGAGPPSLRPRRSRRGLPRRSRTRSWSASWPPIHEARWRVSSIRSSRPPDRYAFVLASSSAGTGSSRRRASSARTASSAAGRRSGSTPAETSSDPASA